MLLTYNSFSIKEILCSQRRSNSLRWHRCIVIIFISCHLLRWNLFSRIHKRLINVLPYFRWPCSYFRTLIDQYISSILCWAKGRLKILLIDFDLIIGENTVKPIVWLSHIIDEQWLLLEYRRWYLFDWGRSLQYSFIFITRGISKGNFR